MLKKKSSNYQVTFNISIISAKYLEHQLVFISVHFYFPNKCPNFWHHYCIFCFYIHTQNLMWFISFSSKNLFPITNYWLFHKLLLQLNLLL